MKSIGTLLKKLKKKEKRKLPSKLEIQDNVLPVCNDSAATACSKDNIQELEDRSNTRESEKEKQKNYHINSDDQLIVLQMMPGDDYIETNRFDEPLVLRDYSADYFDMNNIENVYSSQTSKNVFTSIIEKSEKAFKKVRVFASRPIKEAKLKKLVGKVEKRKKNVSEDPVRNMNKNVFPTFLRTEEPDEILTTITSGSLKYGNMVLDKKNNNNSKNEENNTLKYENPFWMVKRKPNDQDVSQADTEDDLPMNAEVILHVSAGTQQLVPMPNIPIELNAFESLDILKERDEIFFAKEIIFSNTVRNMISLTDYSLRPCVNSAHNQTYTNALKFKEPEIIYTYTKDSSKVLESANFTKERESPNEYQAC